MDLHLQRQERASDKVSAGSLCATCESGLARGMPDNSIHVARHPREEDMS